MKYLSITGARSERELSAYLYDYANPMIIDTSPKGVIYAVVEVPEANAQYQADRMSSGMMGCGIHDTLPDAVASCLERI